MPTEDEWASWPPICRAAYSRVGIFGDGIPGAVKLSQRLASSEVQRWGSVAGDGFQHVHHYCAGLVYLNRAQTETDDYQRKRLLRDAVSEATYTYSRIDLRDPLTPEVSRVLSQAQELLGQLRDAEELLNAVLKAQPTVDRPYVALALFEKRNGKPSRAISVLERGNTETQGQSAEINYNLGLLYFDQKRFDDAVACARRAYALGHPLPGLKNKLAKEGHWGREADSGATVAH